MAEWERQRPALQALGFHLAALSVDSPERSAALRQRMGWGMTLLCDPGRESVQAWNLFNRRERGGIARPATAVLDAHGQLLRLEPEGMTRRLPPADLVAALGASSQPFGSRLRRRGVWPRLGDWSRALRSR